MVQFRSIKEYSHRNKIAPYIKICGPVKNGLNYFIRNDLSFCSPEIEVLFIKIKGSIAKPKATVTL